MRLSLVSTLLVLLMLSSAEPVLAQPNNAGGPVCHQTGWANVSPMSGAVLDEVQTSIGGAACGINVSTHLPRAELQVFEAPQHGDLAQLGPLRLRYTPAPGFQGEDRYSFRYCGGNDAGQSGCATFHYRVVVQ